jgi:hypothetical protein
VRKQADENDDDVARELSARLVEADVNNDRLREEVERLKKALKGFIAENAALKAEIGGQAPGSEENAIGNGKHASSSKRERRAERLTRALFEAAQKGISRG